MPGSTSGRKAKRIDDSTIRFTMIIRRGNAARSALMTASAMAGATSAGTQVDQDFQRTTWLPISFTEVSLSETQTRTY
jgi:hypothetical protein